MTWICKSSLLITTQGAIAGKAKSTSLDRLLRLFLVAKDTTYQGLEFRQLPLFLPGYPDQNITHQRVNARDRNVGEVDRYEGC